MVIILVLGGGLLTTVTGLYDDGEWYEGILCGYNIVISDNRLCVTIVSNL